MPPLLTSLGNLPTASSIGWRCSPIIPGQARHATMSGSPRDDVRLGLRTLAYRRRVTIAFMVEEAAVVVIGFYYGGQDFETILRDEQP